MTKQKNYNVLGIGNPFMDYILHVSEEYLTSVTSIKGGMEPVDHVTFKNIIAESGEPPKLIAGGSGTNAIKGMAVLGEKCGLVGKMGRDTIGEVFLNSVEELGIVPLYLKSDTPTGKVLCLVTPDGERTLRSYLGASLEMTAEELDPALFDGVRLVHVEGYTILSEAYAEGAMRLAKNAGCLVSFDLANFEIINEHKEMYFHLLTSYVDIVFANEKEIRVLMDTTPEEGCRLLSKMCAITVVLRGKKGCIVGQGNHHAAYPAFVIEHPLDTTGAGDLFSSGFLYGYLNGKELDVCARYGALVASHVVQVDGAEIPPEHWEKIKSEIN